MRGTIIKRASKRGTRWGYIFNVGKDPVTGRWKQVAKVSFDSKREATDALNAAILAKKEEDERVAALAGQGNTLDTRTVAEYCQYWLKEHVANRCSGKTTERYGQLVKYIVAVMGDVGMQDLRTSVIQAAIHKLSECGGVKSKEHPNGKPLSPKSVRHIGTLLHTMLGDALRLEHIKPPHPMADRKIILPKLRRKKVEVLDVGKLNLLLDRAKSTRLFPFLMLSMATGCRRGELLALEWGDVNFTTGALTISKSLEQTRTYGLRIKGTKSDQERIVGVDADTLDVLRQHRQQQDRDREIYGEGYKDLGLVFSRPDGGGYYSPDRLGARVVELMKSVGLTGVSLHSIRHSHASTLLSKGVPLAAVSQRLGHANQNITLAIYSHALPADTKAAANIWRDALKETVQEERDAERILTFLIKKPVSL